jgi:hypothetical protein
MISEKARLNNKTMRLLKLSLILSLFYATPTWADYKPATTDELSIETTTVNADGSSMSIYESLTRIETQAAVEEDSQIDIRWQKNQSAKIQHTHHRRWWWQ